MSFGWELRCAVESSDMEPIARHLMSALIFRADWKTGVIPERNLPSLTELASVTGYSRSTVVEWMPRLQAGGWVKVTPPPEGSRDGRNRYQLLIGSPSIPKPVRPSRRRTRASSTARDLPDDAVADPSSPHGGPHVGSDRPADHIDGEDLSGFGGPHGGLGRSGDPSGADDLSGSGRPPGGPDRQAVSFDAEDLSGFGGPPGGLDRLAAPVGGPPGGLAVDRPAACDGPPGGPLPYKNSPTESSLSKVRPPRPRRQTPTGDASPGAASTKGTRLPADFWPDDEMIDWAREQTPLIGSTATDAFIDHWTAQPGAKGERADWVATWRNWMRNEQIRRENAPGFTGRRVQTAVDALPASRPGPDDMCPQHQGQLKASCGPCRGAALGAATTTDEPRTSVVMCAEHPAFPAAFCRPCRAAARTAPDDRRHS